MAKQKAARKPRLRTSLSPRGPRNIKALYQSVMAMLATGESDREVARSTGASRTTVANWRNGCTPAQRNKRAKKSIDNPVPAYKCDGCDYVVVYRPCKICTGRGAREIRRAKGL